MRTRRSLLALCLAVALAAPGVAAAYPDKPIRVVVPVVAGGSTDLVARSFQMAIEKLKALPQPMVIVNNGAAGGVVGTRMIKDAEPDGHTIGAWHMGLLTAPAMGVVEYDHTAYDLIAQVGAIPIGLAVKDDSPVKTVADLVAAAKARPGEVTAAMNVGLLPHFVPLMLAHETGVKFRFVQAGGGAVRLKSVLGGHTEFSLFSVPEFLSYTPSGIRPIVVFTDKRDPRVPNVGTTAESGFKLTFGERVMYLAPKGVPAARMEVLRAAIRTAMADPELIAKLREQGVDPIYVPGPELKTQLDEQMVRIKAVADEIKAAMAAEKKSN
ncbi:MAG: tripartite tricarboxylate transporter substrate binding protein [Alphaproteobacteria bacterium]|nr:tripartite tricarboxylate transporter substrate binding protein [Alphaproteobacteria bacterium]